MQLSDYNLVKLNLVACTYAIVTVSTARWCMELYVCCNSTKLSILSRWKCRYGLVCNMLTMCSFLSTIQALLSFTVLYQMTAVCHQEGDYLCFKSCTWRTSSTLGHAPELPFPVCCRTSMPQMLPWASRLSCAPSFTRQRPVSTTTGQSAHVLWIACTVYGHAESDSYIALSR